MSAMISGRDFLVVVDLSAEILTFEKCSHFVKYNDLYNSQLLYFLWAAFRIFVVSDKEKKHTNSIIFSFTIK